MWHRGRSDTCADSQLSSRISGDAAFDRDILGSVSEQIQKNFARTHWKVSLERDLTGLDGGLRIGLGAGSSLA
jgi:hypothetical protein